MKKKLAVIFTAAMMAMSLCACGKEEATTSAPTTTEATTEATTEETTEAIADDASADDATASDDSMQVERGTIDENNIYTNTSLGISFKIDDNCTIYNDEQILQLLGYGQDIMQDEIGLSAEQMEQAMNGTVYDVWFAYPDGVSNIYAAFENQTINGTSSLDESMYSLSMKSQFEAVESLGYTFDADTIETYGGNEYTCLNAHTTQGVDQKILLRKVQNYMICITISYPSGTTAIPDGFLNSMTEVE